MFNLSDDFEIEEPIEETEDANPGDDLWPEDKENLGKAMSDCCQIFSNPEQADPEKAFEAIEVFEGVQVSFSDARISDQIGEVIEFLHGVCDEVSFSPKDAKEAKRIVLELSETLGIHISDFHGNEAA